MRARAPRARRSSSSGRRTDRSDPAGGSDGAVDDEPGKGAGGGADGELAPAELGEPGGPPVLDVVGGVTEAAEVLATGDVSQPEVGLMRHAQQTALPGDAPDLPQRPRRVGEVLQHLQA